jgi:hypothetical protein
MGLSCCLCLCNPPINFWIPEPIFVKKFSSLDLVPNIVLPSRMWIGVKRQLTVVTVDIDFLGVLWRMLHIFATCWYGVLTQVAKCIDVGDGHFENVLQ